MGVFITRIQLHDESNYFALYQALKNQGFANSILLDDGNTYRLPNAEYFLESNDTIETVAKKAQAALDEAQESDAMLVVSEVNDMRAHRLVQVPTVPPGLLKILHKVRPKS